ncbi:MAG: restriction endonuclease [Lutibacter sp.]
MSKIKSKEKEYIKGSELSLSDFLEYLFSEKRDQLFPNNSFPTNEMKDEYLNNISNYSDDEIKNILRCFLVSTGNLGSDLHNFSFYKSLVKSDISNSVNGIFDTEYYRRLEKSFKNNSPVWEGLSWVLDLLPDFANESIKSIDAYFLANFQFLPDYALTGLSDASEIIKAKYLDKIQPQELYLNLLPTEFELLTAELFEKKGFAVTLTKWTADDGIDILAINKETGNKQLTIIQCKRYTEKVGVAYIRELIGTVADRKATKGILVCSSTFTKPAIDKASLNPSIELINHNQLTNLLNHYLGPNWPLRIEQILRNRKIKNRKEKPTSNTS